MCRISVVLPVFNGGRYIRKAIDSVLSQSFDDFELIIVNDGSTDNTLEIINGFDDERIIIINQENRGPGAARNSALEIAKGEYVMFLDCDDWFCEDLNNFDRNFDDRVFNPHECRDFLFDISVSACQKIFKRQFIDKIDARFPEGIYFEDMPFFFYTFLNAERISLIRKHLYVRQKHPGSITESVDSKFLDTVPAGQILMDIFIESGFYDMYRFDLLAFKVNGPRYALMGIEDKYKEELYWLIKDDYEEIRKTQYYGDYLEDLGPVKRKFFTDILKSDDYNEFMTLNRE